MAGASLDLAPGLTVLGAFEAMHNDGPWAVHERLRKSNGVFTLSSCTAAQCWSASAMGYRAKWTATDQMPQRLIDAGNFNGAPFGRYDTLDPSTGDTSTSSLSSQWQRSGNDGSRSQASACLMRYRLDRNSNFTYAPERTTDGDQFKQQDQRTVLGADTSHAFVHKLGGLEARSEVGATPRHDRIRVGLFDSAARQVISVRRDDRVRESLLGEYGQTSLQLAPWLRSVLGARADQVRSSVHALSLPANGGRASDTQVSPKLSLVSGPWGQTEFFFNAGRGLHSNDARGTPATKEPRRGTRQTRCSRWCRSAALNSDARTEWLPGLQSSVALWQLKSDS